MSFIKKYAQEVPLDNQSGFTLEDNEVDKAKNLQNTEAIKSIVIAAKSYTKQAQLIESLFGSYENYKNLLTQAKSQLFQIDIPKNITSACDVSQAVNMDTGLISTEEFNSIYDMWSDSMLKSKAATSELGAIYNNLVQIINKSLTTGLGSEKSEVSFLGANYPVSELQEVAAQSYNKAVSDINLRLYDYQINERSYRLYIGIYPIKLEFLDHMNALCQVEIDYAQAKDVLKYGGLGLVKKLEDGFNIAASMVEEIATMVVRYNPTAFGQKQSLAYKNIARRLRVRANTFIIEYNNARK